MRKISPSPRFDPRTVQPVASGYTDWSTRPTITKKCQTLNTIRLTLHISCAMSNVQTILTPNYYAFHIINKSLQHVAANICRHLKLVKSVYFVKPDGCTSLDHVYLCVSVHINNPCIMYSISPNARHYRKAQYTTSSIYHLTEQCKSCHMSPSRGYSSVRQNGWREVSCCLRPNPHLRTYRLQCCVSTPHWRVRSIEICREVKLQLTHTHTHTHIYIYIR